MADAELESPTGAEDGRRWMPIQDSPLAVDIRNLSDRQAHRNHNQSLQRLAERGGLSLREALALMNEKKWQFYRDSATTAALLLLHYYGDASEASADEAPAEVTGRE